MFICSCHVYGAPRPIPSGQAKTAECFVALLRGAEKQAWVAFIFAIFVDRARLQNNFDRRGPGDSCGDAFGQNKTRDQVFDRSNLTIQRAINESFRGRRPGKRAAVGDPAEVALRNLIMLAVGIAQPAVEAGLGCELPARDRADFVFVVLVVNRA